SCKIRQTALLFYSAPQLESGLQRWRGSGGVGARRRERIIGRSVEDRRARYELFLESSGGRWWLGRRNWLLAVRFPLRLYRRRSSQTSRQAGWCRTISIARGKTHGLLPDHLQPGKDIDREFRRLESPRSRCNLLFVRTCVSRSRICLVSGSRAAGACQRWRLAAGSIDSAVASGERSMVAGHAARF